MDLPRVRGRDPIELLDSSHVDAESRPRILNRVFPLKSWENRPVLNVREPTTANSAHRFWRGGKKKSCRWNRLRPPSDPATPMVDTVGLMGASSPAPGDPLDVPPEVTDMQMMIRLGDRRYRGRGQGLADGKRAGVRAAGAARS
jgi:hypothetical protein